MYRSVAKKIWIITLVIGILGILILLLFNSLAQADEIFVKEFSWKIDGQTRNFVIETKKNNNITTHTLKEKRFFGHLVPIKLEGFEAEVSTCSTYKDGNILKLDNVICLTGDVGVHAQNLELIEVTNDGFRVINFNDRESNQANIISDVPNFGFQDKGGEKIVYSDYRDYDNDPLHSAIRKYFKLKDSKFVFDRQVNIKYDDSR